MSVEPVQLELEVQSRGEEVREVRDILTQVAAPPEDLPWDHPAPHNRLRS